MYDEFGEAVEYDELRSWLAQPGSQQLFLSCPVKEVLLQGTRGGGKTSTLLMDFAQEVGKGYGMHWRGILFRQTFPQLRNVILESQKWFNQIFPEAHYNKAERTWYWPTGESLKFTYIAKEEDYWNYHGHEYPWIGFEELTTWPTLRCFEAMKSCNRCSHPGVPKRIRATTNPFGPGHNAVKRYFIDPAPCGTIIREEDRPDRVAIFSSIFENKHLIDNDPDYLQSLRSITDEAKRNAWLFGNWDIISGGMFDDVFSEEHNVVKPFKIPLSWRVYRSFDWGSTKPFSVGWHAISDGTPYEDHCGNWHKTVSGDIFRVREWYGCDRDQDNVGIKMLAKEIGRKTVEVDDTFQHRVIPGQADGAIYNDYDEKNIAKDMESVGCRWQKYNKGPGSRINRCEIMREMLYNARIEGERGLYVFDTCRDFLRTIPTLPRDSKNPDDIDTDSEDHIFDECTYFLVSNVKIAGQKAVIGW